MQDFFISYNSADRKWAEWIAWQLEEAGYTSLLQAWDFRPGSNFVFEMQKAAKEAERTIAVLSNDYLDARYTQPECAAAFAKDPTGEKCVLVPVRVRKYDPEGLLPQIIYIDLVDLEEKTAKETLIKGVHRERTKPKKKPDFPQKIPQPTVKRPRFPGALPPIWNVPYNRNPNFTGRKNIIDDLRSTLTSRKSAALTQAIHGLGGIGKTQLALEYVYRYNTDYEIVWWIRAEDLMSLAANYASLAKELNLPEKEEADQAIIIEAVKKWLGHNKGWLLIFDNAQKQEDIRPYLPQGSTGHVILTSRNKSWRGIANSFKIEVLKSTESVEFLYKRTGQRDKIAAAALTKALGNLPLALEQAGAYIEATGKSLSDYLNLFQDYQKDLLTRWRAINRLP